LETVITIDLLLGTFLCSVAAIILSSEMTHSWLLLELKYLVNVIPKCQPSGYARAAATIGHLF